MQNVRIYRLKHLDQWQRSRLRAVQQEGARAQRTRWPSQVDLQRETKGGQYGLHSQSIQLVCQQFLANVATIKHLRQNNPRHRYPYHPKRYMTVKWPDQAIRAPGEAADPARADRGSLVGLARRL